MNIKYLQYGANAEGWMTGIAITNLSQSNTRVYAEYLNEKRHVFCEKSYSVEGIKKFVIPYEGVFYARFWGLDDFTVTGFVIRNGIEFKIDSFPDVFHPPLEENNSVAMVLLPETYYMAIQGGLNCLPEKYATALKNVFRWFFLKTGIVVPVLDLNTCDGSQPSGHPDGFHTYRDVDIVYTDWLNDWKLMRKILDVFPESVIMIDSSYQLDLKAEMLQREVNEYWGRIVKDTDPNHWHLTHFHVGPGGPINWEALK